MRIQKVHFFVLVLLTFFVAVPVQAEDNRLEFRFGGAYGGGSGSSTGGSKVEVDNFGTGLGLATGLEYWKDSFMDVELLSLGVEYQYNHFYTKIDADYTTRGSLDLHSLLLNFAARKTVENFSPYIGAGIGAAYFDASTNRNKISQDKKSVDGVAPMLQAFAGVDYDLSEEWYTGFETKFSYMNANPAGYDVSYHKMDTMLKLGVKF